MKRSFLLMLVLLIAVQASSQSSFIPPIRKDHPRLFFNQDTWPEVERRAKGPSREYLDALLRAVDKITDNPVAARTGPLQRNDQVKVMADGTKLSHYAADIKPIKEFGYQAAQAALAWRFTREDKYLQKAKKLLRVSVDAYTEATNNRRPVNWYSTNRINALCAYDWIYEALTDEERASYIVPLVEHVKLIQPEAGLNIPRTSGGHKGTGFYGTRSLYWYAGVAAYGDGFCDEEAKRQLETGYKLFNEVCRHRNDTAGDDGALLSSSIGYATGFYPYAHFNFFHTHISATGINIAKNYSSMPLLPNWIWWVWIRDSDDPQYIRHSGCGDDYHSQNTLTAKRLYEHLLQYWHFYKDADPAAGELTKALMNYAPKGKLGADFPAHPFIMDINPYSSFDADIKLRESSCKARHFETLGQIYMRSGWNETDTYCCFTAGASLKQHKHYDENNFAIYKGDHLALDTGSRGDSDNLNLRYYFEFVVQKDASKTRDIMTMQIGANAFYNSKWNSPSWNPNLGVFYNQTERLYNNGPYFDAFINIQWKRACIFLKYQNAGGGWPMKKFDYFSSDNRIVTTNGMDGFKIGIYWPFYAQPTGRPGPPPSSE